MAGSVRLRDVVVGSGRTKITAPLCATTPAELFREAAAVAGAGVDIAEWRLDHLLAARELTTPPADLAGLLADLRHRLGDLPLIVTVRSAAEGGQIDLSDEEYAAIVTATLTSASGASVPDAVDLELARGDVLPAVIDRARADGVAVIVSAHDFHRTPGRAAMVAQLTRMVDAGADVAKLAVMAHDPGDVLELLAATHEARALPRPLVTMAMGADGVVSRLAGEVFGSALTFGAVTQASAPGQVAVERLRDAVALVHETRHTPRGASTSEHVPSAPE